MFVSEEVSGLPKYTLSEKHSCGKKKLTEIMGQKCFFVGKKHNPDFVKILIKAVDWHRKVRV